MVGSDGEERARLGTFQRAGVLGRGKNRQARFQSAAASARETLTCLETAEAMGFIAPLDPELAALFHGVIGALVRLIDRGAEDDLLKKRKALT